MLCRVSSASLARRRKLVIINCPPSTLNELILLLYFTICKDYILPHTLDYLREFEIKLNTIYLLKVNCEIFQIRLHLAHTQSSIRSCALFSSCMSSDKFCHVLDISGPTAMKTLAGEAVIGQNEHMTPEMAGNKGRHFCHLSILTNVQFAELSK